MKTLPHSLWSFSLVKYWKAGALELACKTLSLVITALKSGLNEVAK